jgi:hypothetical protein
MAMMNAGITQKEKNEKKGFSLVAGDLFVHFVLSLNLGRLPKRSIGR